jgi:hypothetical protein
MNFVAPKAVLSISICITHLPLLNHSCNFLADNWPQVLDDSLARQDWGWSHRIDLVPML